MQSQNNKHDFYLKKEKYQFTCSTSTHNLTRKLSLKNNSNCSFLPLFPPTQRLASIAGPQLHQDRTLQKKAAQLQIFRLHLILLQRQTQNPGAPKDKVWNTRSLIVTIQVNYCVALEKSLREDLYREWKYICILFCTSFTTGFFLSVQNRLIFECQISGNTKFCPQASIVFLLTSLPHLVEGTSTKNEVSVESLFILNFWFVCFFKFNI